MITGQQVKEAMIEADIKTVIARRCSICDTPLFYERSGEGLFFDSNCDCTSFVTAPQPRSWDDIADSINRQTNQEYKIKWASKFGLSTQSL